MTRIHPRYDIISCFMFKRDFDFDHLWEHVFLVFYTYCFCKEQRNNIHKKQKTNKKNTKLPYITYNPSVSSKVHYISLHSYAFKYNHLICRADSWAFSPFVCKVCFCSLNIFVNFQFLCYYLKVLFYLKVGLPCTISGL